MFGLGLGLGIHRHSSANPYAFPFISRLESDGGAIRDKAALLNLTYYLQSMMPNTKLLYCPELGVKLRTSGIYNYVAKLYDVGPAMLDGSQTIALNQPYLSGNIAPNEKYAIKSPNGQTPELKINFNPISFDAGKSWSVSYLVNWNCDNYTNTANLWQILIAGGGATKINLNHANGRRVTFTSKSGVSTHVVGDIRKIIGKTSLLTIIANSLENAIYLYIDGLYFGRGTSTDIVAEFNYLGVPSGRLAYAAIRDIAMTPTQIQDEYTYLRTVFPEIESVQIGTQTWATSNCEMTCTPMGNVIPEMQAATNVEKITNTADREFSSDTGFWTKSSGWTIADGVAKALDATGYKFLGKLSYVKPSVWYKYDFDVIYISGNGQFNIGDSSTPIIINQTKRYSGYLMCGGNSSITFYGISNFNGSIDNVSIQEVGWADSTNLYNYVYANTTGTAEQKEYAAVKAAAMWCYNNNDPALGAVYGKLYNWYAVKLLQMDIDYYNAANPTTPWGWRVPTNADFTTLSTYLGGDAVSGGKMKKEGLDYWNATNSGADNSSGFSVLGSGYRVTEGGFGSGFKYASIFWTTTTSPLYPYKIELATHEPVLRYGNNSSEDRGFSLRLIKA